MNKNTDGYKITKEDKLNILKDNIRHIFIDINNIINNINIMISNFDDFKKYKNDIIYESLKFFSIPYNLCGKYKKYISLLCDINNNLEYPFSNETNKSFYDKIRDKFYFKNINRFYNLFAFYEKNGYIGEQEYKENFDFCKKLYGTEKLRNSTEHSYSYVTLIPFQETDNITKIYYITITDNIETIEENNKYDGILIDDIITVKKYMEYIETEFNKLILEIEQIDELPSYIYCVQVCHNLTLQITDFKLGKLYYDIIENNINYFIIKYKKIIYNDKNTDNILADSYIFLIDNNNYNQNNNKITKTIVINDYFYNRYSTYQPIKIIKSPTNNKLIIDECAFEYIFEYDEKFMYKYINKKININDDIDKINDYLNISNIIKLYENKKICFEDLKKYLEKKNPEKSIELYFIWVFQNLLNTEEKNQFANLVDENIGKIDKSKKYNIQIDENALEKFINNNKNEKYKPGKNNKEHYVTETILYFFSKIIDWYSNNNLYQLIEIIIKNSDSIIRKNNIVEILKKIEKINKDIYKNININKIIPYLYNNDRNILVHILKNNVNFINLDDIYKFDKECEIIKYILYEIKYKNISKPQNKAILKIIEEYEANITNNNTNNILIDEKP